jgi:hypothetical protein
MASFTVVGIIVEGIGLAVAGWALWHTWRTVGRGYSVVTGKRTAPLEAPVRAGGNARLYATGYVTDPTLTVDEMIAALRRDVSMLAGELAKEQEARDDEAKRLTRMIDARIAQSDGEADESERRDTRTAALGLALAVLGLVLQLIGALLGG